MIIVISILFIYQEIFRISYLNKSSKKNYNFRSKEEKFIASYFDHKKIKYIYEPKLRLGQDIIHPDFYLPEYDVYVEYWGLFNDPNYHETQYKFKKRLYQKEKIPLIELFPDNIRDNHNQLSIMLLDKKFSQRLLNELKII